jgi:hypothetical protein
MKLPPASNFVFLLIVVVIAFANFVEVPRSISASKIHYNYLLQACSNLRGVTLDGIEFDTDPFGGGVYLADAGEIARLTFAGQFSCIAYVTCLMKPTLLPDCNKTK